MSVFLRFAVAAAAAQMAMSRSDSDNVDVLQVVEDINKNTDALQVSLEKASKPLALEAAAGKLAKQAAKAFQKRKAKTEDPCACMTSWEYSLDNITYEACAKTPDWKGANWCYVVGGTTCSTAQDSQLDGEDRKWLECDPCACMNSWEYRVDNATYGGCVETPDWENNTWCYVAGGAECSKAKVSEVEGEDKKWLECEVTDPCDCMSSWEYKVDNVTYEECVETPDWEGNTWCYVEGGTGCDKAKDSEVEGEDRKWMECEVDGASAKSAATRWAAESFSMVVTLVALMHTFA